MPRFRCRFDSDRPLHKIKHLQTLLSSRGNTKEQNLFPPLAESSQPPSSALHASRALEPVRTRPASICCSRGASVPNRELARQCQCRLVVMRRSIDCCSEQLSSSHCSKQISPPGLARRDL